ncbi:MAG: MerC family mercury resistance protein [Sphingomonadales bacterium]|nr:MAG: MerC family mercury resistance protein [Sphingomonadales bacterium]
MTGIVLSFTCLIHCLALPLLLLLAPALSRWIALPEGIHAVILLLALSAAAIAGALTLAAAHLVNWRWRHRSGGHSLAA